ncbi:hypothetical protein [Chitinophaga sp. CF418]|uniref:HYC_CC_PP family protein n=1 Tax=Chitinophaga sp. CF418 TaxID=1855287 RepID=UPI000914F273|nr:hypothetical protein [Chitinophaga sp. CF418]SHN34309.1 hypothetical protein SAMN05216311_109272 [Chitinophaga sp. CF418]
MKINSTIRLKAAFLLVVFALNTMIGFACAVGMGFNSKHHHEEASSSAATHHHKSQKCHHHDEAPAKKGAANDDNCCNKNVIQFSQLDKLLTHAVSTGIETPVTIVFLHDFYLSYLSPFAKISKQNRVVHPYFSSSPDIRVSIQSFLI